jgi:putative redox protein
MIRVEVKLANGEYGFEAADAYGHKVKMDTSPDSGGQNFGVRPMQMILMGLAGCSGIDIMSILRKQRQKVEGLRMYVEGTREQGKDPSLWEDIRIIFEIQGEIAHDKARRACELSMDKYCSVAATLRKAGCKLEWELRLVHGKKVE